MEKAKLDKDFDLIFEEASILVKMDHPSIVKYYEMYQDKKYIYLVMEYIRGEALYDKIVK